MLPSLQKQPGELYYITGLRIFDIFGVHVSNTMTSLWTLWPHWGPPGTDGKDANGGCIIGPCWAVHYCMQDPSVQQEAELSDTWHPVPADNCAGQEAKIDQVRYTRIRRWEADGCRLSTDDITLRITMVAGHTKPTVVDRIVIHWLLIKRKLKKTDLLFRVPADMMRVTCDVLQVHVLFRMPCTSVR